MSYIGDARYNEILDRMRAMLRQGRLSLRASATSYSPDALGTTLARVHNEQRNQNGQTNAEYLGLRIDGSACAGALSRPRGYPSASGWRAWAGLHSGHWYNHSPAQTFTDDARWHAPRAEPSRSGPERTYDFQPVDFMSGGAVSRRGWNQSHRDVDYVWGWDPKSGVRIEDYAPHIGYTFRASDTECIIWITPAEAFLECVRDTPSGRRRTSAGILLGVGQWAIA